jgi:tetratricopeptide (TPR) repeat protein
MAEETTETGTMENLQEQYSKVEQYILENRNTVAYIGGGVLAVVLVILLLFKWYYPMRNVDAMGKMYFAQKYFAADSFNQALNGDGKHDGFLKVAKNYSMTPAGKMAHYYAGVVLLKQGKFEDAITHLKKFDANDKLLSILDLGLIGDAYSELGKTDDAVSYYKKAAYKNENENTSPKFLHKAGLLLFVNKKYKEAKEVFEETKQKYHETQEGRLADRYIAAIEQMGQ